MTKLISLRTVRMGVLSVLFALMTVFLLTFGVASAQSVSRVSHADKGMGHVVHIRPDKLGRPAYKPHKITVQVGQPFTIINSTDSDQTVTLHGQPVVTIAAGQSAQLTVDQPGVTKFGLQGHPKAKLLVDAH